MSERYIVQTPSLFQVDETFDDPRFMKVRIAAMHSGENYNRSTFETKVLKASKNSFANIPILANIIKSYDEDGNEHYDYGSHDMHKEEDAFIEGEKRIIYDEKVVGIVPESNNFEIIHNDENNKDYVYVDALIYRDYGGYAADILEARGGMTSVSAELNFDKTSYDVKNKLIVVEAFTMYGITLLGEDVAPAMEGANASVFSVLEEQEDNRQEQLVNVMKELTQALNKYTATFAEKDPERKEEKEKLNKELFEKLCEQYSVTEEDITFEYSELDDEALTSAFAEHFDGDGGDSSSSEGSGEDSGESGDSNGTDETSGTDNSEESGGTDTETETSGSTENNSSESDDDPVENNGSNESVSDGEISEDEDEDENYDGSTDSIPTGSKLLYSLTSDSGVHEFALSLNEEICAITDLVNITYSEEDGDWYSCEVYSDKTVIMHGWYKHFKQKYTVKDGVYSLKGERTEVFAKYLTQEEIEALEGLKAKFAETSAKLDLYESEPDKIAVLSSEDYSLIKDTEEYKELSKRENYFNLSTEELTSKLEGMLNTYAKELGKKNFSVEKDNKEKETEKKDFFAFARIKTESSFLDGLLNKKNNSI